MDDGQQSVCATLSRSHYLALLREVQTSGIKSAVSNRTNGDSTESTKKDIRAMQEIDERGGF